MDYGKIVARAWEMFWKHKILWVFGILSGTFNVLYSIWSYTRYDFSAENYMGFRSNGLPYSEGYLEIIRWANENMFLFITAIVLAVLGVLIISYLIYAFGYAGMINGYLQVSEGAEKLTFRGLVDSMRPIFWRLFGLNLFLGVGGFGVLVVIIAILLVLAILTFGMGMLCFFPLICLMAPVFVFLGIVVVQAMVAIAAENLSIKDGLVRAWQLVTKNIGPFLLVWLILFVISVVVRIVIALPSLIALAPVYAAMFSFRFQNDPSIMLEQMADYMTLIMIWAPFQYILGSLVNTYILSAWVQTYLEVRDNGTLEPMDGPEPADPDPDLLEQTN